MRVNKLLISGFIMVMLSSGTALASKDGKNHDYRTFTSEKVIDGQIWNSYTSDLVMYLAGNQFMVMDELIKDFQKKNPDIKSIYVETIPPGQILNGQILKQGMIDGQLTSMTPDLYASVNLGHLKKLKGKGKMKDYFIYTHNKLELMVAEGNPRGITGPKDLSRDDLVQSHPNPMTEGIFKFYGSQMLKDLNLYGKVIGDAKCKSCWAVPGKTWLTSRHHRETPYRIENNEADVGIVWVTEVVEAKRTNRKVEGVTILPPYNQAHRVGYAVGLLKEGRNQKNAQRYLDYLKSDDAQDIYVSYGFGRANKKDLKTRVIPSPS